MKLEDMCLTLEQARELKELGVDFSNSMLCFYEIEGVMNIGCNGIIDYDKSLGHAKQPTITITEMLEMLPKDGSMRIYRAKKWDILYINYETHKSNDSRFILLRDALFDMIKWLKTNKLI